MTPAKPVDSGNNHSPPYFTINSLNIVPYRPQPQWAYPNAVSPRIAGRA